MANVAGTTLADNNNNPVNLKNTDIPWKGAVGSNAGFETFSNPELGVRAGAKNLYTSQETHGNSTLAEIITRHAPPEDYNDTLAYIDKVSADTGIGANDTLPNLKDNPELTEQIITSMTDMEGGTTGPHGKYPKSVIENGVAMANGKPESEIDFSKQDTDFDVNTVVLEKSNVYSDPIQKIAAVKAANEPKLSDNISANWMSLVDSPTYRWTLYVVSNDTWNNPSTLHGDDSAVVNNNNARIISKTGVTTEFTMDNFVTVSTVIPGQVHGNTTPGIIQFDIFETMGFTLLDKVLKAGIELGKPGNLYAQNYILKLEFVGRDPKSSGSVTFPGIFFYRIKINQIRSTTGPEGTRYNVIGWSINKHAMLEAPTHKAIAVKNVTTVKTFIENLEIAWNQSLVDDMTHAEREAGVRPYKTVKFVWDDSTTIKNDINKGINNFMLPLHGLSAGADTSQSGGQSINLEDATVADILIAPGTNICNKIVEYINMNCKSWIEYREKSKEHGVTFSLSVTPVETYPLGGRTVMNRERVLITFNIKIYRNETTANSDIQKSNANFADNAHQLSRFKRLPIEKNYTYLYSGLNTEVLSYQIDVENLYFQIHQPSQAMYSNANLESFAPTTPSKPNKSPYIEDIVQHPGVSYNTVKGTFHDVGGDAQQQSATSKGNAVTESLASNMSKRDIDAMKFEMEIKGDPYWMGNMMVDVQGKLELPDYDSRDALVSFLQYQPSNDLLNTQTKGPVDYISSGVYKLQKIESRFQGGRFTQALSGYKDPTTNIAIIIRELEELSGV